MVAVGLALVGLLFAGRDNILVLWEPAGYAGFLLKITLIKDL